MPYPLYTIDECEAAVVRIDGKLERLEGIAIRASLGGGRYFDHAGKRKELLAERETWINRLASLSGSACPPQSTGIVLS